MGFQKGISVVLKQVSGALLAVALLCTVQFWISDPQPFLASLRADKPYYSRDLEEGASSVWLGDSEGIEEGAEKEPGIEEEQGVDTGITGAGASPPSVPLQAPGDRFVVFNVLPKSGSRTLNSLAMNVAARHGVDVENTMALTNESGVEKMTRLLGRSRATFLYSHMPFSAVRATGGKKVVYISVVRDPIERLVSLYYYKRYGDSTGSGYFRAKMDKLNLSKDTFDECARRHGDCVASNLMSKTILHFCGSQEDESSRSPTKKCLSKARENVRNEYLVVGVMDDYLGFIQVLERLLPDVFQGAETFYRDFVTKSYFSVMQTKNKTGPSEEVRAKLRRRMVREYEFYDYVKHEFETLKRNLGIA